MTRCTSIVTGSGGVRCLLETGHSGHHASVAFQCDACGKTRRGTPHAYARDGEYEHGISLCFLCAGVPARREAERLEWTTMNTTTKENDAR